MMTMIASTLRVHDLRLMLDASAERLADAEADAAIAPVKSAHMSDASADFLTNAKANAADAPSSACICSMRARIASLTPRPMLLSRLLSARERPMPAPIALLMPG
jgi:hypothetical protein